MKWVLKEKTGIFWKPWTRFWVTSCVSIQPPVLVDVRTLNLINEDAENSIEDTSSSTAESNGKMLLVPAVCVMLAVAPLHHHRGTGKYFVKIRL